MFEHRFVNKFGTALCRFSNLSLIEYHAFSTLNSWQPNFFVSVKGYYNRKIQSLKLFKSQNNKSYFQKRTLSSFHSNFQCSKKGLKVVDQFKVIGCHMNDPCIKISPISSLNNNKNLNEYKEIDI